MLVDLCRLLRMRFQELLPVIEDVVGVGANLIGVLPEIVRVARIVGRSALEVIHQLQRLRCVYPVQIQVVAGQLADADIVVVI